jgi:hypothetical protein
VTVEDLEMYIYGVVDAPQSIAWWTGLALNVVIENDGVSIFR